MNATDRAASVEKPSRSPRVDQLSRHAMTAKAGNTAVTTTLATGSDSHKTIGSDASRPRFSAIRFLVTGAASAQPLQISALLRRATDQKTLWIQEA